MAADNGGGPRSSRLSPLWAERSQGLQMAGLFTPRATRVHNGYNTHVVSTRCVMIPPAEQRALFFPVLPGEEKHWKTLFQTC